MASSPIILPFEYFDNRFPVQRSKEDEILSKFGDMFDKLATSGDSSTKWVSATIIACSITITLVILKYLMKKEPTSIPTTYSPISTSDRNQASPISDQHIAVTMPPVQQVVSFSQILGQTVETFLKDIARERPIRFSCLEIDTLTDNRSSLLGSGGYGEVYRGKFQNGVMIAVKVLKAKHSDKRIKEQFMAEVGTLGRTHHVNLVKLYGFCFDPTMRALVYEYMENGSLDNLIFNKSRQVKWEKLHQIAIGVAKGLAYLHEDCEQKIIHYDIKPANVLLDSKLNPKVADFGLARLCNNESNEDGSQAFNTRPGGTTEYAAPETLSLGLTPVTNKCDVYSFGLMLMEIIGRRRNYDPSVNSDVNGWLVKWIWKLYQKDKLSNFFSESGIEEEFKQEAERVLMVVFLCVHHDPKERPTMSNVVKMLEGEKEINPPSYPFEDVESTSESHGYNDEGNDKSNTAHNNPSHSKPLKMSSEIELVGESH